MESTAEGVPPTDDVGAHTPEVDGAARPRRRALPWTVLVTLVLISLELLLLTWVYDRAAPDRQQRIAASYAAGQLSEQVRLEPGRTVRVAQVLDDLSAAGVQGDGVRQVEARLEGRRPVQAGDPTVGVADAAHAVDGLRDRLAHRQHVLDAQATALYVVLLLGASLGWAVWFRRLVARHRDLQRQLTEQQATAFGERRMAALLRNASDLTLVCDVGLRIVSATPSAQPVLGRTPEDLLGTSCLAYVEPADRELLETFVASRRPGTEDSVSVRLAHPSGQQRHAEITLSDLTADPAVDGIVVTIRDVTTRWRLERQLSYDALHDGLTGIGNRRLFTDRVAQALNRAGGEGDADTVLVLDLADFKTVNDVQGQAAGDEVLRAVAGRLAAASRTGDSVARLGGDQFALLLEGTSLLDAEVFARRLLETVAEPIDVDGTPLICRAVAGLAAIRVGVADADTALRNADVAMYHAKRRGPGHHAHYEERLHARELERLQLRAELEHAIATDQLVLHYQPIASLETGRMVGIEALVRWEHPTRGLLPPLTFVPLAEESGLIIALGSWVLARATAEAATLPDGHIRLSVNVAAPQLSAPDFVAEVGAALRSSGLRADSLCLEITESSLVRELDEVKAALSAVRTLGVTVAVDDFGTGYSSLSYLANLPIDVLKVDKSFLDRVTLDEREAQLAEAIIGIGRTLGMQTTAEGIEQAEQATWLRSVGCSHGQGYLWSRPVPFARILELAALPGPLPAASVLSPPSTVAAVANA